MFLAKHILSSLIFQQVCNPPLQYSPLNLICTYTPKFIYKSKMGPFKMNNKSKMGPFQELNLNKPTHIYYRWTNTFKSKLKNIFIVIFNKLKFFYYIYIYIHTHTIYIKAHEYLPTKSIVIFYLAIPFILSDFC